MKMQPIEFITANKMDFLSGNVIKYVARGALGDMLDPRSLVDLDKARHYLDMLIDEYTQAQRR